MRNNHYYTIVFKSTHYAIAAEKYLSESLSVTVMPTLRKISASCGMSIRIEPEDIDKAIELLNNNSRIKKNSFIYEVNDDEVRKIDL